MASQLTGNIDRCFVFPLPGNDRFLFVEGWILHPEEKIISFSIAGTDQLPLNVPVSFRSDVASMIPHIPHAGVSGFAVIIRDTTALSMKAHLASGQSAFVSIPLKKNPPVVPTDLLVEAFGKLRSKEEFSFVAQNLLAHYINSRTRFTFARNENPAISIIIPVHNKAEYTLLSLSSLMNQSQQDFEIIIVDNDSTDDTKNILAQISGITVLSQRSNLHYLAGCNEGAKAAKSDILLFMNNDCVVRNGAVHTLVSHFSDTSIGAVGALLITPPGTIQEAGCRALFDGSTIGIQRFQDPRDADEVREVDYCSGAFLATPRKLFNEVGGFNEAFSPAYGEDVDYCLTLKDRGMKVICDPHASLIHLEHGSSHHDVYVTQLIEKSKNILKQRHPDFFQWKFLADLDRKKKNLLVVDDLAPDKKQGQGLPRAALLLEELGKHFASITFLAVNQADQASPTLELPPHIHCITSVPRSALPRFLADYGDYFSAMMISRPPNMEALEDVTLPAIPIIYDAESVFAFRDITKRQLTHKVFYTAHESAEIVSREVALARRAQVILAVSEREAKNFRDYGFEDVEVLSHGIKTSPTIPSPSNRKGLLTVSPIVSGESPNFDGSQWFIRDVLPRIQNSGKTDLTIIGKVLPSLKEYYDLPNVTLEGLVPDISSYYNNARVFIAPTRFGAGIPLKVIEASAFGLPSVVTPLLAAQLGWEDGNELLVGKDPEDFANKVISIIKDDSLWEHISKGALQRISAEYAPELFGSKISRILRKIGIQ